MTTSQPYFEQWFNLYRKGTLDKLTCAYLIVWTFTSAAVVSLVCLINSVNPLLQARLPIEAVLLIQAGITTHYIRLLSLTNLWWFVWASSLVAQCVLNSWNNRHAVSWPDAVQSDYTRLCWSVNRGFLSNVSAVLLAVFLCCVICVFSWLFLLDCQYQCKWLTGKTYILNDL